MNINVNVVEQHPLACAKYFISNFTRNTHRDPPYLGKVYLLPILPLDPAGDVKAPSHGAAESTKNIIPFDPATTRKRIGLLLQHTALDTGINTDSKAYSRKKTKRSRGHLAQERSKDLRGRIFTLPEHRVIIGAR